MRADRGEGSLQHRGRADGRRHGDPPQTRSRQGRDRRGAIEAAGAVILGKLQMTEGAYGLHHPTIEPPVNP